MLCTDIQLLNSHSYFGLWKFVPEATTTNLVLHLCECSQKPLIYKIPIQKATFLNLVFLLSSIQQNSNWSLLPQFVIPYEFFYFQKQRNGWEGISLSARRKPSGQSASKICSAGLSDWAVGLPKADSKSNTYFYNQVLFSSKKFFFNITSDTLTYI